MYMNYAVSRGIVSGRTQNRHFIVSEFYETLPLLTLRILIMKANEMHYFSNLFDKVLYMFRTCPLSIIRSISTLYTEQ